MGEQRTLKELNFRAGWIRVVFGVLAAVAVPLIAPKTTSIAPVAGLYIAASLASQVGMQKEIGGRARVFAMGMADMAMLTFYAHRIGSLSPTMNGLYIMIAMFHAMTLRLRTAQIMVVFGASVYGVVLYLEATGALPYAPDGPAWSWHGPVHPRNALNAGLVNAVLMLGCATIVGKLIELVRNREAELERLSQRDALTELFNRRHLMDRIDHELERVRRGHPLTMLMIDLDHFKALNDTQGHLRGDEALVAIASVIVESIRKVDIAGRYGGDEFIVLLSDTTAEEANTVVDRLVKGVRGVGVRFDTQNPVTASVGVAEAERDDDAAALIRRADANTYAAKRAGGNRVSVRGADSEPGETSWPEARSGPSS